MHYLSFISARFALSGRLYSVIASGNTNLRAIQVSERHHECNGFFNGHNLIFNVSTVNNFIICISEANVDKAV